MIHTAIFGGTFDPPHLGHLAIARAAMQTLKLDNLIWMVTPDPPHKTTARKSAFNHRYEMSQLCVSGNPTFLVSDFENNRPGPHYTIDTIRSLKLANLDVRYSLLIGGDSLRMFSSWREPRALLEEIEFLSVFSRFEKRKEVAEFERNYPDFSSKLAWIEADPIDISSSKIREYILKGVDASEYLTNSVWEYIQTYNLYRDA